MRGNFGFLRDIFVFLDEFSVEILSFYYSGYIFLLVLILFSDISELDSLVIVINQIFKRIEIFVIDFTLLDEGDEGLVRIQGNVVVFFLW